MLRSKLKYIIALIIVAAILILLGFGLDNRLQTTNYNVEDRRIPSSFDGYRIAQISDFHNVWVGKEEQTLIDAVASGKPDIIVLTGDIFDANHTDYDCIEALFKGLSAIAPLYAVAGNHEESIPGTRMNSLYTEYGIHYLDDEGLTISQGTGSIYLYGLRDRPYDNELTEAVVKIPVPDQNTYGVLLYHRSDKYDFLSHLGYGLVLSGHLHGGLIRFPFIGGIIKPEGQLDLNQKYTGGMYIIGNTTLISNRGLAGSYNEPRIFNRPEIVFVTLHHQG